MSTIRPDHADQGLDSSPEGIGDDPLSLAFAACAPARGPRRCPVSAVPVDDDLVWITPVPAVQPGAARVSSPAALVHLSVLLAQDLAAAQGAALEAAFIEAELVDAAARAVAGYLDDLPDLPLVGEPFGGEEGTD